MKKWTFYAVLLASIMLFSGCGSDSDGENNDTQAQDDAPLGFGTYPSHVKRILFAHGLNADKASWGDFANSEYIEGWTVYRFSVDPIASIEERATSLATQINAVEEEGGEPIPDDSLVVVGHSMGGLDLHYIISKGHEEQDDPTSIFYKAAKKFHKFYTIASPHKGNEFGGVIQGFSKSIMELVADHSSGIVHDKSELAASDAVYDLGLAQMQAFNKQYPYTTFTIDDREIPLMALRFSCWDDLKADGVVAVQNQSLNGAPHSKEIYQGEHMGGVCDALDSDVTEELKLEEAVLNDIILSGAAIESETHDIIFYEGNNCEQDEKGIFTSSQEINISSCPSFTEFEADPTEFLNNNGTCDNDEIRSVKIFPTVAKGTYISVYDGAGYDEDDDWAVIYVGDHNLEEAVCINSFESDLSQELEDAGIEKFYHEGPAVTYDGNRLDGKISSMKISKTLETDPKVLFYEALYCKQNLIGGMQGEDIYGHIAYESGSAQNDEMQSLLLFPSVENNTIIKLYDSPSGSLEDDWFFIDRGTKDFHVPFCVNGFEHSTSTRESDAGIKTYYQEHDGLNGKVSYVKVSANKDNKLVFFEGSDCTQNVEKMFDSTESHSGDADALDFQNDEIRSVLLQAGVKKDTFIRVFDDGSGSHDDDWTEIEVYRDLDTPICIDTFETDRSGAHITAEYHEDDGLFANGLDGKISYIRIYHE